MGGRRGRGNSAILLATAFSTAFKNNLVYVFHCPILSTLVVFFVYGDTYTILSFGLRDSAVSTLVAVYAFDLYKY